jgi:undecaprenyl-diphosphatase
MFFIYLWIATQIIVEMMPISSSGHLYLLEVLFKKNGCDIESFFSKKHCNLKRIYYCLHLPTLLIICSYFAPQWISFVFHDSMIDIRPLLWVVCADMITGALYLCKPDFMQKFPLGLGFLITAIVLLKTSSCSGHILITSWNYIDAVILGFAQAVALVPGISRLAMTCFVGCLLGFSLLDAFCLSWMLQVPLMILAIAKSIMSATDRKRLAQLLNIKTCLAIIMSSGLSWIALLLVIKIIQLNWWYVFGWYMILPIIIWVLVGR